MYVVNRPNISTSDRLLRQPKVVSLKGNSCFASSRYDDILRPCNVRHRAIEWLEQLHAFVHVGPELHRSKRPRQTVKQVLTFYAVLFKLAQEFMQNFGAIIDTAQERNLSELYKRPVAALVKFPDCVRKLGSDLVWVDDVNA